MKQVTEEDHPPGAGALNECLEPIEGAERGSSRHGYAEGTEGRGFPDVRVRDEKRPRP
jgi:hypothetical protein